MNAASVKEMRCASAPANSLEDAALLGYRPGGTPRLGVLSLLRDALHRAIHIGTGGRISGLQVEFTQVSVVLRGRCDRFSQKKDAQDLVMTIVPCAQLSNHIEVGDSFP